MSKLHTRNVKPHCVEIELGSRTVDTCVLRVFDSKNKHRVHLDRWAMLRIIQGLKDWAKNRRTSLLNMLEHERQMFNLEA